jgi:hypothetical protein
MNHPEEFRCLGCGVPVEDRYWCDGCRYDRTPPEQ